MAVLSLLEEGAAKGPSQHAITLAIAAQNSGHRSGATCPARRSRQPVGTSWVKAQKTGSGTTTAVLTCTSTPDADGSDNQASAAVTIVRK
ncbi:MAG: hypothetical protein ACR2KK_15340 [Acidimicrobiales bacterium]